MCRHESEDVYDFHASSNCDWLGQMHTAFMLYSFYMSCEENPLWLGRDMLSLCQ